jgi:hypothetical protein
MIEAEKLNAWAPSLALVFEQWRSLLRSGELMPWEFVAHYLLIFVFLNRPRESWRSSRTQSAKPLALGIEGRPNRQGCSLMVSSVLEAFRAHPEISNLAAWADCSYWVYGDMRSLRGVPEKVLFCLRGWREGKFQIDLLFRIPTAQELLAIQVLGRRCVTALVETSEISQPVETGRDVWSFCLHDLLHGSHFFSDGGHQMAQRYLSHFFLEAWTKSSLKQWVLEDSDFGQEFVYVAADMNAHPVYIFLCFYAQALNYYKRRLGVPLAHALSAAAEVDWQKFWRSFLLEFVTDEAIIDIFADLARTSHSGLKLAQLEKALLIYAAPFCFKKT